MVKPLPHLGPDSSLMQRVSPPILTTPGRRQAQARRRWESNFLLLLQFRDREGHLRVPRLHVEDFENLGTWISGIRTQHKAGTLCPERLRRLNEIGFIWNAREAKPVPHPPILTTPGGMILNLSPPCPSQASRRWESNFLLLLQFRDREGHLRVPTHHVEDGHKLGSWICMNRA
jgi:hypothetical protein